MIDLEKGTEYGVRIKALTVNGSGPSTSWIMAETFLHDLDGKIGFISTIY